MEINSKRNYQEEKTIIKFIAQTKEGKYANIDEESLKYSRINEQTQELYETDYYYGIR